MRFLNLRTIELLVVVLLLVVISVLDLLFYLNGTFPAAIDYLREIILAALVLFGIHIIRKSKFMATKAVVGKLKGLYLAVAGLYLVYLVLKIAVNLFSPEYGANHRSVQAFLYGGLFSILSSVVLLAVLLILKDLVFFKRKKTTAKNFILMLVFLGLYVAHLNLKQRGVSLLNLDVGPFTVSGEVLLYILILLMVINALRNSWVTYLSKRQKIHCLWLGIPLIVGAILFQTLIARQSAVVEYSVSLAALIQNNALFLSIYLGMSFFSLLLHLPTAGIFDRKIRELESLHDLSRTLSTVLDSQKISGMITQKAADVINSDAVWLAVLDSDSRALKVVSSENLQSAEIAALDLNPSNGVNGWIIENKTSILINEMAKDPRCKSFKDWNRKFGSLLGVPLLSKNGVLGILFSGRVDTFTYGEEERQLLQAFANQAAIALENARLFEEVVVKERLEQELKVAHDAQRKLLPKKMPELAGFEIDAISITANEVGGDYYDFFELEGKLGIAVGDVSGKGAKAAFYMAELKGIIEALAHIYSSPKDLMIQINRTLVRNLEPTAFISLIYAVLDIKKRELSFSRAGHCPLLFCPKRGEPQFMEPRGLGLGLEFGKKFEDILTEQKIKIKSGEVLLFYTDGVIEARNSEQKEFDQERLRTVAAKTASLSARQIKDALVNEIRAFVGQARAHDDLTFVVLKAV